jgi:hypothetical protein
MKSETVKVSVLRVAPKVSLVAPKAPGLRLKLNQMRCGGLLTHPDTHGTQRSGT